MQFYLYFYCAPRNSSRVRDLIACWLASGSPSAQRSFWGASCWRYIGARLEHRRFGRLAIGEFEVDKCVLEVIIKC